MKGLRLPILLAMKEVFRMASPQYKLTPAGFLDYLLNNNKPRILSNTIDDGSGYIKDVKVRYKKRWAAGKSVTTDDCSIQGESAYFEQVMPSTMFRKIALFFDWTTIEKFTEDALATQQAGTPGTELMKEVIDSMATVLNGFIADINNDLLALQAASFGVNIVPGNNAAKAINFALNSATNPLNAGITEVMSDAMLNEVLMGNASIVGSGLINNFYLQQGFKEADQAGINTARQSLPKFYFDPYAQAAWGANQFGLFEKDAVQFINICRFRGPKGRKWGNSEFGTIQWPIVDSLGNTGLRSLEFDFQARQVDCPTDDMVIGGGDPEAKGRGLVFDLMSSYATVGVPSTAYDAADRLNGVNGTFRFSATNA
jgi:hypothetical protein